MDSMTVAGARLLDEVTDWYVIYDDGSAGHMQVLAETEPVLSRPGRFVTRDEYSDRLGELNAATAAYVAELTAADEARQTADYEALLAAGVPDDTARRMSGLGHG
jgi:hypothetical protein